MTHVGELYENPVTGERVVVRVPPRRSNGHLLVADLYVRRGGAVAGEHVHPSSPPTCGVSCPPSTRSRCRRRSPS